MTEKFKTTWFRAALGKNEETKGLIFQKAVETISPQFVDMNNFAELLQKAYEQLDAEGFDVVNVVPISMGAVQVFNGGAGGMPVGFNVTRGAVVVGKKRG